MYDWCMFYNILIYTYLILFCYYYFCEMTHKCAFYGTITTYHILSCLFLSYHVLSYLILSQVAQHVVVRAVVDGKTDGNQERTLVVMATLQINITVTVATVNVSGL